MVKHSDILYVMHASLIAHDYWYDCHGVNDCVMSLVSECVCMGWGVCVCVCMCMERGSVFICVYVILNICCYLVSVQI